MTNNSNFFGRLQDPYESNLKTAFQQGLNLHALWILYEGFTDSTDETTLYIRGMDGSITTTDLQEQQLLVPPDSSFVVNKYCFAYNATDDQPAANTPEIAMGTIATRAGTANVAVTQTATHTLCDLEADTTNQAIKVSVTAADTDDTYWKVYLEVLGYVYPSNYPDFLNEFSNTSEGGTTAFNI